MRPSRVEIFVMNADTSEQRQITAVGGANFGPSWTPDGKRIIFSSNHPAPRSGNFDLYLVDASASMATADKLERVTFDATFDAMSCPCPAARQG